MLNRCCLRVFNALIFQVQTARIYCVKYALNMCEIHIFYVLLTLKMSRFWTSQLSIIYMRGVRLCSLVNKLCYML